MKSTLLLCVALSFNLPIFAQSITSPDTSFQWTPQEEGRFWTQAINCGRPQFLGGSQITFGITSHTRFPGTQSARFYTNAAFQEVCNQNFSSERAEIHANEGYASLGVEMGSPGSTVWVGWSEMYTHLDRSHSATLFQFLSGEGSPAVSINYYPKHGLVLRKSGFGDAQNPGIVVFSNEEFQENVWYDFVVEMKYSFEEDGYVKVWAYKSGEKSPALYAYSDAPSAVINGPTLHNGTTVVPPQADVPQRDQGPPRFRWGVYRWDSGDLKPSEIDPSEWLMVKYLGPARVKVGDNLNEQGFEAVKARWEPDLDPNNTLNFDSEIQATTIPLLLNVGGDEMACSGGVYRQDQASNWFGASQTVRKGFDLSSMEELYATERTGSSFGTNISLPSGSYTITLHFSRIFPVQSGSFNVYANNREVTLMDLSSSNQMGNQDLVFSEKIHNGLLQLHLEAVEGQASLAGISIIQDSQEVAPLIEPTLQLLGQEPGAIRINAGSSVPLSFGAVSFQPDIYFPTSSLSFSQDEVPVTNTRWEALYESQRQGRDTEDSLVYQIPVTPGAYSLRLHFAAVDDSLNPTILRLYQEGKALTDPVDLGAQFGSFAAGIIQRTIYIRDSLLDLSIASEEGIPGIAGIEIIPEAYFGLESSLGGLPNTEVPAFRTSDAFSFRVEASRVNCNPQVYIWPNPAINQVNISLVEGQKLEILSLEGRIVEQRELDAGFHELGLDYLPTGVYILRWENSLYEMQKLVVANP